MGQIKVILPAMGEGIFEATITQWLINEGDKIEEDDSLVEIATDKVDSEVPSPVTGILTKILVPSGEIAKINQIIALIDTEGDSGQASEISDDRKPDENEKLIPVLDKKEPIIYTEESEEIKTPLKLIDGIFLSPLVRSIANAENISIEELAFIKGTGLDNRITKDDMLNYLSNKSSSSSSQSSKNKSEQSVLSDENVEIIEMDRVRRLIAEHMVHSKQTSPHVTSFHEVDVTDIVKWREKNKNEFLKLYGSKLTFTPIFIDAVVRAIKKYPMINISVDGDKIIIKKSVNIGMATALPNGNLIVPVIHKADGLSLPALAGEVNDLANRARTKQLMPNEIQGGTFTITNVGTFGNLSGTPIINQPEVAILAIGAIKKRPAVIETTLGDFIGIRHQMVLALSYDHRVVDGSLGGMFLKQIADNMESFNGEQWF